MYAQPNLAPSPPTLLPTAACDTKEVVSLVSGAFSLLGVIFISAAMITSVTQPKLFRVLWLVASFQWVLAAFAVSSAAHPWFAPEQCPYDESSNVFVVGISVIGGLAVGGAIMFRRRTLKSFFDTIKHIEGDLPRRLEDGSLRLLRVAWLLKRPADWVLKRRQELPDEALWSPTDAARLLREGKVAALSYKWQGPFNSSNGGGDQPDGKRFHLNAVVAYYREPMHAEARPALMWDFASLPQHDPITGEKRTDAENAIFKAGLSVMSNAYASPRVLVLQHRRIPPELAQELDEAFGGKPPADRADLIPYAGEHCRSGWCTFECACALLMTAGGGHAHELGIGKAPVARGQLPSVQEMEVLFHHESTRFIGTADRDHVSQSYLQLRKELEDYDERRVSMLVRASEWLLTDSGGILRRGVLARVLLLVVVPLLFVGIGIVGAVSFQLVVGSITWTVIAILTVAGFTLPSRIVRALLAAGLGYRTRDSLEYTFHYSLIQPPFRRRTQTLLIGIALASDSGVELVVPSCFLPRGGRC